MDTNIGSMVLLLTDIDILCAPFQVSRLVSLAEMRMPDKRAVDSYRWEAAEDADLR